MAPVKVAVETNAPSASGTSGEDDTDGDGADDGEDQMDVIVYTGSKSTTTTTTADPNHVTTTTTTDAPVAAVVLEISTTSSPEATTSYKRGSAIITTSSSGTTANVIGGRSGYTATTSSTALSTSSTSFHDFLRYASVAFAGISVALLAFFHYISMDASLVWASALWCPNSWELVAYVGYLQQMASVSQLTVLKTPYFLWEYTDGFSWTNFLIQKTTSDSAVRRLDTVVLGGIVSYADRIGIDESVILYHTVAGFAFVFGLLLVLFLVVAMLAKRKAEQALDTSSSDVTNHGENVRFLRNVSIRTLGLCVLLWYFSLFPLSMMAAYEINMEVASAAIAPALSVALISLIVICFGIMAVSGRVVLHKTTEELQQFENLATWGTLYGDFTYRTRMFFLIGAIIQIAMGIFIGSVDSDPTQLILVICVLVLFMAAVFIMAPYADRKVMYVVYALTVLKLVNFALAFAFLNSNTMSSAARYHVADAYIGINTIIIMVWFIRQLIVFSHYIRAWMLKSSALNPAENNDDLAAKYDMRDMRSTAVTDAYASVNTARAGNENGTIPAVNLQDLRYSSQYVSTIRV